MRHLDRLGWDATVITAEPHHDALDEALIADVPDSTAIVRVPWVDLIEKAKRLVDWRLSIVDSEQEQRRSRGNRQSTIDNRQSSFLRDWFSRLLITPDSCTGWIAPAVAAGLRAARQARPKLIYSTSPCMSAHLIALIVARRTRLPWVADFRDPWGDNPFRELKFASLRRWDGWLERRVLARADHVVCATPSMSARLAQRHPAIAGKVSTILNGFDAERFTNLKPTRIGSAETFVIAHAGQFYGLRSPRVWLAALRRALDRAPAWSNRLRFLFIGPDLFEGRSLADHASEAGVGNRVDVLGPKRHAEALSYLAGSDGLMLAGVAGTGADLQVPNKLFEYLALRKPIIAACSRASPIVEILTAARAEAVVCEPEDESSLADAILQLATRRFLPVNDAWGGVDRFERANRAEELAALFRRCERHVSKTPHRSSHSEPQASACAESRLGWVLHGDGDVGRAAVRPRGLKPAAQGARAHDF